jgi:hypothetical protein
VHQQQTDDNRQFAHLVGNSEPICTIRQAIEKIAESAASALVRRLSGSGKATSPLGCSRRAARPFVAINCAAIVADLLESKMCGSSYRLERNDRTSCEIANGSKGARACKRQLSAWWRKIRQNPDGKYQISDPQRPHANVASIVAPPSTLLPR